MRKFSRKPRVRYTETSLKEIEDTIRINLRGESMGQAMAWLRRDKQNLRRR